MGKIIVVMAIMAMINHLPWLVIKKEMYVSVLKRIMIPISGIKKG
jgi:hypothetical protein